VGSIPGRVKAKTMKLVFVASPLSMQYKLRIKSKDGLAQNQDNVSEWGYMSIHGLVSVSYNTVKDIA